MFSHNLYYFLIRRLSDSCQQDSRIWVRLWLSYDAQKVTLFLKIFFKLFGGTGTFSLVHWQEDPAELKAPQSCCFGLLV